MRFDKPADPLSKSLDEITPANGYLVESVIYGDSHTDKASMLELRSAGIKTNSIVVVREVRATISQRYAISLALAGFNLYVADILQVQRAREHLLLLFLCRPSQIYSNAHCVRHRFQCFVRVEERLPRRHFYRNRRDDRAGPE